MLYSTEAYKLLKEFSVCQTCGKVCGKGIFQGAIAYLNIPVIHYEFLSSQAPQPFSLNQKCEHDRLEVVRVKIK
jgi:hypothetical protein